MRSYPYQVLGTPEREESLFFMIDAFLRSRIETGEETTDDEDVNMYVAGLLHSFLDRSFYATYGKFLSEYNLDIFTHAEQSGDLRTRYRVYRGNADYALVSVGVFDTPATRARTPRAAEIEEEQTVERGKLYYRFASHCNERLARKRTGIVEVLDKLAERFETYVKILARMRTEHLHLLRRLSEGQLFHLERDAQEGAQPGMARESRDRFLDAYGNWLRSGSELDRNHVNRLGEELSRIDPDFKFDGV